MKNNVVNVVLVERIYSQPGKTLYFCLQVEESEPNDYLF